MLTMFTTLMVSIVYCTSSVSSMILPPMSLHPPMLVPVDTTATAVSTPTLTYDDDDYDVDDDTIGDTPEHCAVLQDIGPFLIHTIEYMLKSHSNH